MGWSEYQRRKDEEERRNPKPKQSKTYINKDVHRHHDSIYTMGNDEATVLYIAVMLVGTIFNDRLLIWIAATMVYYLHMTRHNRR